jgi:HTH-type transcriptional regulator/antitoxin HipB
MKINSPEELGHLVREHRSRLGITQAALAKRVGATRHWVIALERGNPTAEFDRVLKALIALGLRVDVAGEVHQSTAADAAEAASRELSSRTASGGACVRRLSTAAGKDGGGDAG